MRFAAALCLATGCASAAVASGPPPAASLADLRFLTGTWRGEDGGKLLEESWAAILGMSAIGTFRVLEGSRPVFYEFAALEEREGTVLLELRHFGEGLEPVGRATFRLERSVADEAVFVPTGEDDVQRLTYRRNGDELVVILERARGDQVLRFRLAR